MKAKRLMLILLCTTVVGAFTACGAKSSETDGAGQNESNVVSEVETNDGEADEENTQIANPWVDCASMEDAVKIAGFSFEVPKQIEGYPNQVIQAIENDIIQVIYDDGTNSIYIRKGAGTEDIGGRAYGQMLLEFPDNEELIARAKKYLDEIQVHYEEEFIDGI